MRSLLPEGFMVLTAGEAGIEPPEETGETFAENALIKARVAARQSGLPSVADDSGLVVDALDGRPGVRSARFAADHGRPATDDENTRLVLELLASVPDERRRARFIAAVAFVSPEGDEAVVHGTVEGHIGHKSAGANGFGYDPIFVPEPGARTMAELTDDRKNQISHRGKAFRQLVALLTERYAPESKQNR